MRRNECVDAAVSILSGHGIRPEVKKVGKHIKISWLIGDRKRSYFAANTASDVRAIMNVRATVKRLLREDGVQKI
jgi:hypothetical protein